MLADADYWGRMPILERNARLSVAPIAPASLFLAEVEIDGRIRHNQTTNQ